MRSVTGVPNNPVALSRHYPGHCIDAIRVAGGLILCVTQRYCSIWWLPPRVWRWPLVAVAVAAALRRARAARAAVPAPVAAAHPRAVAARLLPVRAAADPHLPALAAAAPRPAAAAGVAAAPVPALR